MDKPTSDPAAAALRKDAEAAPKVEREGRHGDPTSDGAAAALAALKLEREGRHGEETSDVAAAALRKEAEAAPKLEREGPHEEPMSDVAAAALRKEAEEVVKLERKGRHGEAIKRVEDLAATHGGSALVLHLAGHLHHDAALRAVNAGDGKAMAHHIVTAHSYLAEAKRLVPNCIAISNFLASVLFLGLKAVEAEREAREAVNIAFPVDPADNSVLYTLGSTTRDQRVDACRKSARDNLARIEAHIPGIVREVLAAHDDDGARKALKKAKDVAKRFPSSSRAQLLSAHMQLQRLRLLGPDMDMRLILGPIRLAMEGAIANSLGGSLVLALFHAKLCFVLCLYETVYFECVRAFAIPEPLDPKLEDIPPYSVQGDEFDDRVASVKEELLCLLDKLFSVANDFRCSMTSEKQDSFLSVPLIQLQEYYDKNFGTYQWAPQTTISDALSFLKENLSWTFWICPFCASNELPENSLLDHMNSKHLPKLQSILCPLRTQYVILGDYLDRITVYQDSEGHHVFRFNKTEYVFEYLSVASEEMSFAELQEKKRERGKEILEQIKDKLKPLPAEEFSTEFDKAHLEEIQDLWFDFVETCMLDYRIVIMTFAKPFIWTKLLQSLSEDKASSKIYNDDIDVIFPRGEVRAEDKVRRLEIHPNSNIADVQSSVAGLKDRSSIANENSASNLLGSSSQSSEDTTIISIYRKSIEVLDKDTDDVFILNFIFQVAESWHIAMSFDAHLLLILYEYVHMLWNLRCFRDEFLKRRPVCTLPCHEGPCISQMLYGIFSAWEKDDHHITESLISVRDTICQVLNDRTVIENVDVNTSSYIVTNILNGLKMPEVFLEVPIGNSPCDRKVLETSIQAANAEKVLCNKEINCGGVGIEESTTCGDKLDADSLQITEESFAADKLRISIPEFSTLAVHMVSSEGGNQHTLREVMLFDPDVVLFRFPHITPDMIRCTFVSMIFYRDGKLLSIVRCQNKWLVFVYNEAVATEFNSLEDLLQNYGDHEIHPGVCFFDNIKFDNIKIIH